MDNEKFGIACRNILKDWFNKHGYTDVKTGKKIKIKYNNTFIVWKVKVLGNNKILASTTVDGNTLYAEFTYNGAKSEVYCDMYEKVENFCVKAEDFNLEVEE